MRIRWMVGACLIGLCVACQSAFAAGGSQGSPPPPPANSSDCSYGTNYAPYGWVIPNDPLYGLGYDDPQTKDLVGFAAKGNIVIGDYTYPDFKTDVLPKLEPPFTQSYVVDQSDASLGYESFYDAQGRPVFNGRYTDEDGGTKLDGSPRKFYESSVPDAWLASKGIIDNPVISKSNNGNYGDTFDGVFFTNHAFTGKLGSEWDYINGAVVARDDAFIYNTQFTISHDVRLVSPQSQVLQLPFEIKRPQMTQWEECPAEGCPSVP